mgnify:CR=1 FL=1
MAIDIAIIGMSCRFPMADSIQEYWNNLIKGVDCVRQVPSDRWDADAFYSTDPGEQNKSYCRSIGAMDRIDLFDNQFFRISPREAAGMAPQQRLLLQESWHCVEDSNIPLKKLQEKQTGVFIGSVALDSYRTSKMDIHTGTGLYYFMLANRISYCLGLSGDSHTLDTGCSSSFVAMHSACQSLLDHSCDYALVGASNLHLSPRKYFMWSKARMLSRTGKCHTFDRNADGYVSGEGIAVILLQPLDQAVRDRHRIYGVIKGCAVNHGGKGISMTAPISGRKEMSFWMLTARRDFPRIPYPTWKRMAPVPPWEIPSRWKLWFRHSGNIRIKKGIAIWVPSKPISDIWKAVLPWRA